MSKKQKIIIENNFQYPIVLCIEPWATEYGMMPNDKFEIVDEEAGDNFYFHLVFENKRITVFVEGEGSYYPQIYQSGELLNYGHNRELVED